jgi:hypothetical protein
MTLNELEGIKTKSKEDKSVDILLDNNSAGDISVSFKGANNSRYILHRWHCIRSGI